jgi:hypothetical protein
MIITDDRVLAAVAECKPDPLMEMAPAGAEHTRRLPRCLPAVCAGARAARDQLAIVKYRGLPDWPTQDVQHVVVVDAVA